MLSKIPLNMIVSPILKGGNMPFYAAVWKEKVSGKKSRKRNIFKITLKVKLF